MTDGASLPGPERVAAALADVRRRIADVPGAADRDVEVMAVTKGFAPEIVRIAAVAGCELIGENYAQELLTRAPVLDALADDRPRVAFIGHLQSNKVRQIASIVDLWATVDRASLAREIAKRAPGAHVLVQLNTTGEEQKSGVTPGGAGALVDMCREFGLRVDGVLAMGPTGRPPEAARPAFDAARRIADDHGLPTRSLGMSGDLEVAVAAGSTQVRIGTDLFGPRPPR